MNTGEDYDVIGDCVLDDVAKMLGLCLLIGVTSFVAGRWSVHEPSKEEMKKEVLLNLTGEERHWLAIDYACKPNQRWTGMRMFCGSLPPADSKGAKK